MRSVGVTAGQEVASQLGSSPRQVAGEAQFACVVTVQLSSTAQQTPRGGCGHGFGLQVSHSECQTPGAEQSSCVVTVQIPVAAQHALCGGGHGFGLQIVTSAIQAPSTQSLA
jgi:hypothetical protein